MIKRIVRSIKDYLYKKELEEAVKAQKTKAYKTGWGSSYPKIKNNNYEVETSNSRIDGAYETLYRPNVNKTKG